jgi:hypothetical protein
MFIARRVQMTNLRNIEWQGGTSAHSHHQRPRSQRDLVEASLLRHTGKSERRWDERTGVEYTQAA